MHNPKVLAALKEEMGKRIALGAIVGIYGLQAIATDPDHKDHLKACVALADRGGYSPIVQQNIKVDHTHTDRTGADLMKHLRELAALHGEEGMALLRKVNIGNIPREIELKPEPSDG